ncbi:TauD/TfdA dioxygenase family protein [Siccirubricoccus deserti]
MAEPTITPLGYAMGAEVTGLDLRRPIDDLTRRRLYEAWLKHVVLVFPGQALTPQQHIAFSAISARSTTTPARRRRRCWRMSRRSWW